MPLPRAVPAEYLAATTTCGRWNASARQLLRITGDDRVSYLQGMVTNDVAALGEGQSCYAAMLTAKGAMVADARILRRADDLVLDVGEGRLDAALEFLNKYLISEDAELLPAPELALVGLLGPQAEATAAALPPGLVQGRFTGLLPQGLDLLVARDALPAVQAALAAVPSVSEPTFEVLRVEAKVPTFGVDMTETTIPLEANLDHAIHYKKGCYIGQEVIARATYRGQMNKKLVLLMLGDATPDPKAELKVDDRRVGRLTSIVHGQAAGQVVALGYVHRDFLTPGTQLAVASGGFATVA